METDYIYKAMDKADVSITSGINAKWMVKIDGFNMLFRDKKDECLIDIGALVQYLPKSKFEIFNIC